ncbi:MAG: 23S rRNA (guanosine(2251)-2'-O)-methyltransferase RlmB [Oscillospiraceae bacterium]|nr:23S rRNA (guanosine(2251)-2'-O)-methyltransferase RlmB [Oscillospiraceae bacterium]MCL2279366.1 23S rRNA (guanosine(2251)-2'-O)-methyltransferase RlmB [Oscillospiraceae bacterium]
MECIEKHIEERDDIIEGRNTVIEALRAGVSVDKVFIARGDTDKTLRHIASKARDAAAVVVEVDKRKLDQMSVTHSHQGVIAMVASAEYVSVSQILDIAESKGEKPLIVICDGISDPHNLGAIIRTCEAVSAHGVIIPKRRSAGLSAIVAKTSGGAVFHTAVARVANLSATIKELKSKGVWVVGAAADADTTVWEADFTVPTAFVIGSEGSGIGRLVGEVCDYKAKIPMEGKLSSLNASVSAAIFLFEARRQRLSR